MTAMCIPRPTLLGDLWPILERLIRIFEKPQEERVSVSAAPEMHRDRVNENSLHCVDFSVGILFPTLVFGYFSGFFIRGATLSGFKPHEIHPLMIVQNLGLFWFEISRQRPDSSNTRPVDPATGIREWVERVRLKKITSHYSRIII